MRMIQKKPSDRFRTLREMIELIEDLEVKLAGTTNVLRKSRGPFRAMSDKEASEHARMTSQGIRPPSATMPATSSSPPPDMPASPPGRASSGSRLAIAAASVAPARAVPVARPASADAVVPDWLRPVEEPVQPRKSSSNLIPPATPPQPQGAASQSGFRDLRAKLTEARNRNLSEEAETLVSEGNRLAASGDLDEAAGVWTRAAALIPDATRSQQLIHRARKARKRDGLWRWVKLLLWLVVIAGVLVAGAFFGVPQGHRLLAERELAPISEITSLPARRQALESFVATWGKSLDLYVQAFRRDYAIEPVERAKAMIEQIKRTPAPIPQPKLPPPVFSDTRAKADMLTMVETLEAAKAPPWSMRLLGWQKHKFALLAQKLTPIEAASLGARFETELNRLGEPQD